VTEPLLAIENISAGYGDVRVLWDLADAPAIRQTYLGMREASPLFPCGAVERHGFA